jgi:Bacterial protein of unknown function (DUF948)
MSAGEVAVLIAAGACVLAVVGLLVAVTAMRRQIHDLSAVVDQLQRQTVPLVADVHRVVDQAATEMERIDAVLESTESVHATVDSASRLAYRAFANPVVKVLALRAGAAGGVRQLRARPSTNGRTSAPGGGTHGSGSGRRSR